MSPLGPLFGMNAFMARTEAYAAITCAVEIAAELTASAYGPAEVGGGELLCLWPPAEAPGFVSVSARPISPGTAWVRVTGQGLGTETLDTADQIAMMLESRLGTLGPDALPPPRDHDYDREASRLLEGEIQRLLEESAADPSAWEHLSRAIFERELLLQDLTGLGV